MGTTEAISAPVRPVIKASRYDQVLSLMIALITVFVIAVLMLATMVKTKPRIDVLQQTVPVEFFEDPGGDPNGDTTDPTQAGSGPAVMDATQADIPPDETEKVSDSDDPVSISSDAADQLPALTPAPLISSAQSNPTATGSGGSGGTGTGTGRLFGHGPGKGGGFPREERWFIRYSDTAALDEYARQLDYFGIELGAIVGQQLVYISQMSGSTPQVRRAPGGGGEKRLYFTWQGGSRKRADVQLFQKAGIAVGDSVIFQFYPKNTENLLAKVEFEYERRKYNEIRRTYFAVRKPESGSGYEFYVTRQVTFK